MKELTYKQVSVLLNISEQLAMAKILSALGREVPFSMMSKDDIKVFQRNFDQKVPLETLSIYCGVDLKKVLFDLNENFLKNRSAMDYVVKQVRAKLKNSPNSSSVIIPPEITSLMAGPTKLKLVAWLRENVKDVNYVIQN